MTSTSTDRINGARSSLAIKAPVKSASIGVLVLSGEQTVDGVALVTGDRILVKNQASGVDNGIYIVDTGTWERAPDADGNSDWAKSTLVAVTDGATTSSFWRQTTAGPIVVGTTALAFSAASLGTVTAYMTTVLAAADATTAFALLAAAGLSFTGDISPAALAANTNDWAPAGFATASTVRVSSSLAINLTGIAAGADGRFICLHNIGAFAITLKDDATSTAINRFQLAGDYVLNPDASVAIQYDSTSTRWRVFGQQGSQASVSFNRLVNNVGLSVTMNSPANACTIALKDATGADPSAASPCTINVRSGTITLGTVNQRTVQAALSTVISSGSTGGTASAIASRIYVAAIDAGGTIELAWGNFQIYPDENALISTTAEGGAGAADTINTWYSTTARASVAFTLLGFFESTQATAGTWVTAVSKLVVNANPYPAAFGASKVLLSAANSGSVAAVDLSLPAGFSTYELDIISVTPATDNTELWLRVSEDSGGTFKAGGTDYAYNRCVQVDAGAPGTAASTGDSKIQLAAAVGNGATKSFSGLVKIAEPSNTARHKVFTFSAAYEPSANTIGSLNGGGIFKLDTNAINAIRIMMSSGNITLTYALYGIRSA